MSTLHLQLSSHLVSYIVDSNTHDELLLRRLYSNFLKYGPIARVLLDELDVMQSPETLDRLEDRADSTVLNKINACIKSTDLQSTLLQQFSMQDSHSVFMMEPALRDDPDLKLCSVTCAYSFRSEWIARECLQQAGLYAEGHSRMLFEWMSQRPFASTVAGWVFEEQVHVRLGAGGTHTAAILTPLRELEDIYTQHNPGKVSEEDKGGLESHKQDALSRATTGTICIWLRKYDSTLGQSTIFSSYTDLSKLLCESPNSRNFDTRLDSIYLRPAQSNFPAIDGLVVCVESNYPRAYFFQMTIAKAHPVLAQHLYDLWVALPSSVRRVPPALVWVVPKLREGEYTKPQPIDDRSSNKIPRGLNPKNWPQYRIGIDSTGFLGNKALGRRVVSDTSAHRYGAQSRTSGWI